MRICRQGGHIKADCGEFVYQRAVWGAPYPQASIGGRYEFQVLQCAPAAPLAALQLAREDRRLLILPCLPHVNGRKHPPCPARKRLLRRGRKVGVHQPLIAVQGAELLPVPIYTLKRCPCRPKRFFVIGERGGKLGRRPFYFLLVKGDFVPSHKDGRIRSFALYGVLPSVVKKVADALCGAFHNNNGVGGLQDRRSNALHKVKRTFAERFFPKPYLCKMGGFDVGGTQGVRAVHRANVDYAAAFLDNAVLGRPHKRRGGYSLHCGGVVGGEHRGGVEDIAALAFVFGYDNAVVTAADNCLFPKDIRLRKSAAAPLPCLAHYHTDGLARLLLRYDLGKEFSLRGI